MVYCLHVCIVVFDIVDDVDTVSPFVPVDNNIFTVKFKEVQAKQVKDRDLRQEIKINPSHFPKAVVEQVKILIHLQE